LPKQVVDRIAAGEVVQRPASIAKELIENSLDADATSIDLCIAGGGLSCLNITDDGFGFHPNDLMLAATRFATSKLISFDDLKSIKTFGFRGEALASASMVGRLTIVSKKRRRLEHQHRQQQQQSNSCAFKLSYTEGKPNGKATPSAGKEGTQVKLQDLFYNMQSRRRSFAGKKKENEEYLKILAVVQRYAVHCARNGVGFVCRKKASVCDLNTTTLTSLKNVRRMKIKKGKNVVAVAAVVDRTKNHHNDQHDYREKNVDKNDNSHKRDVDINVNVEAEVKAEAEMRNMSLLALKEVVGHVFGTRLTRELLTFEADEGDLDYVQMQALKEQCQPQPQLNCTSIDLCGGNTVPTTSVTIKDCSSVYQGISISKEASITHENIHTLETFAFRAFGLFTNASYCGQQQQQKSTSSSSYSAFILFVNDRLVESSSIRRAIEGVYLDILPRQAKPFIYLSLELPGHQIDVNVHPTKREVAMLHEEKLCKALTDATIQLLRSEKKSKTFYTQALLPAMSKKIITSTSTLNDNDSEGKFMKRKRIESSAKKDVIHSKDLIRINLAAEQGAIEPYLSPPPSKKKIDDDSSHETVDPPKKSASDFTHNSDCGFALVSDKLDMNKPGAFAMICRCMINRPPAFQSSDVFSSPITRQKRINPIECSYTSIEMLRQEILSNAHQELTAKLRESVFVGCVSRHRSLLQSGIELLIMNHVELLRELFYQLAVLQFGGIEKALLGNSINVQLLLEKALIDSKQKTTREKSSIIELAREQSQCLATNGKFANNNYHDSKSIFMILI
jgi:DNA mismatch repair protein MLH1